MKEMLPFVVPGLWVLGIVVVVLAVAVEANRGAGATPPRDAQGRLLLTRKLILAGGALVALGSLLTFVPGFIPWWDYGWSHGAIFGFLLGYFIHMAGKIRRGLAATRDQGPKT